MIPDTSPPTPATVPAPPAALQQPGWKVASGAFVLALGLLLLGYLFASVPASWFPSASPLAWPVSQLQITRGAGSIANGEMLVTATDSNGVAVVSLTTSFPAADYPAVAWLAIDVPASADVRLLWRNDYTPQKVNSIGIRVESGRLLPSLLANEPDWIGRISGLALVVRAPLTQPLRIAGAEAKPTGAIGVLADRTREWLEPERWTGTSINTVTGGADVQSLPLPLLLGGTVLLASLLIWLWKRLRKEPAPTTLPILIAVMFVTAWFLLDARWMTNLAGQVASTMDRYGGKDWREKHVAAEDGPLFNFIESVRAKLPDAPVRIFVASDANYFRSRAAYHLYPNNVYADPYRNVLPSPEKLRKGDWVVVYQRRGVQYDASTRQLRWDGQSPLSAELRFTDAGAALFEIQ